VEFILRNFLSNAIKFSHRDSAVQLGIQLRPQHIVLEVRDYGVGLSSDKLTKIKNRDMITSYGTNNEKGSGLGLLICFDLAAKNEAEIEIDSEEGKGSTFRVVFPKL
jgi:signal transduction histidine kinase